MCNPCVNFVVSRLLLRAFVRKSEHAASNSRVDGGHSHDDSATAASVTRSWLRRTFCLYIQRVNVSTARGFFPSNAIAFVAHMNSLLFFRPSWPTGSFLNSSFGLWPTADRKADDVYILQSADARAETHVPNVQRSAQGSDAARRRYARLTAKGYKARSEAVRRQEILISQGSYPGAETAAAQSL